MRSSIVMVAGALAAGLIVAAPGDAGAIECPEAQMQAGPGEMEETSQQMKQIAQLLETGDSENRIDVIINGLRTKYPDADNTMLANYMIAAYCQEVVAEPGSSESEKTARMDAFSQRIWTTLQ